MTVEKENVGVKGLETEQGAKAQAIGGGEKPDKIGSTVWDKFKDADALAKAYDSLQSEFTRRSQKLRELERRLENFHSQNAEKNEPQKGAEKLRKNAERQREESRAFNEFVEDLERAVQTKAEKSEGQTQAVKANDERTAEKETPVKSDVAEEFFKEEELPVLQADGTEKEVDLNAVNNVKEENAVANDAQSVVVAPVAERIKTALSSDELYERASKDESVRLKIIGEYLSSLGKSVAPMMTSGAGGYATPPAKAKTIAEAGNMALRFFKK